MSFKIRALVAGLAAVTLLSLSVPAQAQQSEGRQTLFERLFGLEPGERLLQPRTTSKPAAEPRSRTVTLPDGRRYRTNPIYDRQTVTYQTAEATGTIVVDTSNHFLYLVLGNGQALRYGIGVARDGFEWSGTHRVTRKAEWPGWTPPAEMRKRQPELPAYMEGGPGNPLGARALYLGSTLYRIHGTAEPWTIGHDVSSGCIRLTNEDVMDLYTRVGVGAKVVVI